MAKDEDEFEEMYVSDDDFEDQIEQFRTSKKDIVKFCVGYTGIGKTTSIRHCFDLGVSKEAHINTGKKELVFPTFLDGYQAKDIQKFDLSTRIAAVCTTLEEKHPELRKYFPSEDFVTIKLYSSEEFLNDTTQYQDNQTHINNEKDFNSVYGYDWTLKNTKNGTLVNNGVMYSTTNDGKYIPIGSAIPQTTPEKERQYTPYNNFKECIFDKVGENIDTANKGQLVMKMDNNQLLELFKTINFFSPFSKT